MKYFLIAGEASGDLHASALITQIKQRDPEAEFAFLGGDMMAQAAGQAPLIHYRDMAFMGIIEVVKNLGKVMRNMKTAKRAIDTFAPDRLILVDYPSFNLKMAKYAKKRGIKVAYYIPPKIWAWKEWRVKEIKKYVDQVLAIFPFEVPFYAKHGVEAIYVGNPSVEEIERDGEGTSRDEFIKRNRLPDKPIIAMLPGSRLAELRNNLPIMAQVAKRFPQYRAVIAGAPGIDPTVYDQILGYPEGEKPYNALPIVFGQTPQLLAVARAGLVTSGTATLEAALHRMPQVAMFRHNGKKWMRTLKKLVLSIEYVTLPNLIADREIIPEMLLDLCTPDGCSEALAPLLTDSPKREQMIADYADMRQRLGHSNAPAEAARLITQA